MALNPALLRLTTPPDAPFDLHLPAGTTTLFQDRIAQIPEAKRGTWRYHRVAADDTVASIARTYHVTPSELATANNLGTGESLQGVEALVVPVAPAAAPSMRTLLYTTRKGDTLVTIADRFGVSLEQLRRWNQISGTKVETGRRLHVAEPPHVARASTNHHGKAGSAKTSSTSHPASSAKGAAPKHVPPNHVSETAVKKSATAHRKSQKSGSLAKSTSH
jgi:membrane-bound lytic murein transglycosylase D